MKTARICVALAVAGIAIGQTSPKDVDGWGKVKWGMTMEEARAALNIETRPDTNEHGTSLTLKPIKIGDISMNAYVVAKPNADRIVAVRLWLYYGLPDSAPFAGPHDFDTLRTQLIQKYGSPVSEETKREYGDPVRTVLWTFPSTSILLKLTHKESSLRLGHINLEYSATDKKALDVL